jgi:pimeloyl-ACP methyl ester carboxylesterase
MYSYAGSTSSGKPLGYKCSQTLTQSLGKDANNLDQQIVAGLKSNPNTDIYLIGHSLGGLVAFDFLSEFFVPGSGRIFPSTAHLKGVITLDTPLGGVSPDAEYTTVARLAKAGCSTNFRVLDDMQTIFKSASRTPELPLGVGASQGARATVTALEDDFRMSNEMLAERARMLGVSILSVGNENDFLFNPSACHLSLPLPNFIDTQVLEDQGDNSQLYGRYFTATTPKTCKDVCHDISDSHFAVLTDKTVQMALSHFLPNGATPSPLLQPGEEG